jgi:hypothetical protein
MLMTHLMRKLESAFVLCLWLSVAAWAADDEPGPLTDADVSAILERGSPGVFYAWSPHMPLSVDGLQEIYSAGERLDIDVIPVLSSHANVAYARDRIEAMDLPDSVLRQGLSDELIERDLFVHAPAILIFDGGRFVSPVLPGLRHADDYAALITRFLDAARQ